MSTADTARLRRRLTHVDAPVDLSECLDRTILGDAFDVLPHLPAACVDLLVADPPYNLTKSFDGTTFRGAGLDEYERWLRSWLALVQPALKQTASVYLCSDWRGSAAVQRVAEEFFLVRNRITWEREKGRGALRNWKNCAEDIWFCTVSGAFHFDVEAVKLMRRVLAPYRNADGKPRDWRVRPEGNFRQTHPSNLWTDLTVPFWSMPENTDHPTQKPEKLIAKLILASSPPGAVVLDPFLGSGTTSVVAKKLGRRYIGIEISEAYSLIAERRLEEAEYDASIQGYEDGVFWERNARVTTNARRAAGGKVAATERRQSLFEA